MRQVRTRPTFSVRTRPLVSSTPRCWSTAGSEIVSGFASSLTVAAPRLRRSRIERLVGSASAWKTGSASAIDWLSIRLSISRSRWPRDVPFLCRRCGSGAAAVRRARTSRRSQGGSAGRPATRARSCPARPGREHRATRGRDRCRRRRARPRPPGTRNRAGRPSERRGKPERLEKLLVEREYGDFSDHTVLDAEHVESEWPVLRVARALDIGGDRRLLVGARWDAAQRAPIVVAEAALHPGVDDLPVAEPPRRVRRHRAESVRAEQAHDRLRVASFGRLHVALEELPLLLARL